MNATRTKHETNEARTGQNMQRIEQETRTVRNGTQTERKTGTNERTNEPKNIKTRTDKCQDETETPRMEKNGR